MSQGTASVEGAFPINKDICEVDQKIDTLKAVRICEDGLRDCGGLEKFNISKEVILAAKASRMPYEADLQTKAPRSESEKKKQLDQDIYRLSAKIKETVQLETS